jgi:UDPglucose 6-dehydrogenase
MPGYIVEKLKVELGELAGKKVAVFGLAFKAGTSDTRKSPGVAIANLLVHYGAEVVGYDPQGNEEAREDLHDSVTLIDSPDTAGPIDALVVATEWPEFRTLSTETLHTVLGENSVLIDAVNIYSPQELRAAGIRYIGVGR